ncbi:hypothetical protein GGS20DRAFT_253084 [Poronia punctata]|nr:hypothetical protein GGS20DRAFT_253084 [Poronia punctata]
MALTGVPHQMADHQTKLKARQSSPCNCIRTLTISRPETTTVEVLTLGDGATKVTIVPGPVVPAPESSNRTPSYVGPVLSVVVVLVVCLLAFWLCWRGCARSRASSSRSTTGSTSSNPPNNGGPGRINLRRGHAGKRGPGARGLGIRKLGNRGGSPRTADSDTGSSTTPSHNGGTEDRANKGAEGKAANSRHPFPGTPGAPLPPGIPPQGFMGGHPPGNGTIPPSMGVGLGMGMPPGSGGPPMMGRGGGPPPTLPMIGRGGPPPMPWQGT